MNFPGAPSSFFLRPVNTNLIVNSDTVSDITLPFVTVSGKTTDSNGVAVSGVELQQTTSWSDASNVWHNYTHSSGAVKSDASGNYKMLLFPHVHNITEVPPISSGFAQTPINGVNVTQNILQNIILSYPDTVPPIILSGPTVSAITDISAVIEWQTNEPSTGSVKYGLINPPGTSATSATAKTIHSVPLTGLAADTIYYINVEATDTSNNGPTSSTVISFRTKPIPDTKSPVIIEGPVISTITHTGAVVEWRTDEPSTGSVSYGLTDAPDQTLAETTLSTTHRVSLTGLTAETLHYVKVSATDAVSNGPTVSPLVSFTTQAAPDTIAPVIVEGPLAVNISASEATIIWKTDEPATSGISWNDGAAYGLVTDEGFIPDHNLRITGLTAATTYNFTVSSKDSFGNGPTLSKTFTFTTPAAADTAVPVIIEGPLVVNVTHQSAVIRWETDEPADSVIEFGTTTSFGETDSRAALTKPHNLTLTGLAAGTTYYFRVNSRDAAGNITTALGPYTFTTDAQPGNSKPVLTVEPHIIYQTDTSATIYWETDTPTDTVVDYGKGSSKDKQRAEAAKTTKHQVTLVNLEAEQGYGLSISSTDLEGNTVVADAGRPITFLAMANFIMSDAIQSPAAVTGFMTNSIPDTSAPVITAGPEVIAITNKLAVIRWVTDEISDSRVQYGLQEPLIISAGDIRQGKEHTVVLTNLTPNSTYSYRVGSADPIGNGPTYSQTLTFTTGSASDSTGPAFTVSPAINSVTKQSAVITWTTDELSTTQIKYGTANNQLTQQIAMIGLTKNHSLTLTGLKPDTSFYVAAVSVDCSGNTSQSNLVQFTTLADKARLEVTLSGTGNGSVNSNPAGIACINGTCSAIFDQGGVVTLMQLPDSNSIFSGWSRGCTNSTGNCVVNMNGPESVNANFSLAPLLRLIGNSTIGYSLLQNAYNAAQSGNTIQGRTVTLVENFTAGTAKTVVIRGGYDADFGSRSGYTVLDGVMRIRSGKVIADGLKVR